MGSGNGGGRKAHVTPGPTSVSSRWLGYLLAGPLSPQKLFLNIEFQFTARKGKHRRSALDRVVKSDIIYLRGRRKVREGAMKAFLVVIAALSVSPAYAFENLVIDSTFQYPVVLTGKVTSWSDVQLTGPTHGTNAPVQNQSFSAGSNFLTAPNFPMVPNSPAVPFLVEPNLLPVPNLLAAPNLVPVPNLVGVPNLLPIPNPLVSASPLSLGAQTKPAGNFSDAQLVTTSPNAPQLLSNVSPAGAATQTLAPTSSPAAQLLSNVLPAAAATQTLASTGSPTSQLLSNVSPVAAAAQTLATSSSPALQLLSASPAVSATQISATSSSPAPQLLSNASPAASVTQILATSNSPAPQPLSNVSPALSATQILATSSSPAQLSGAGGGAAPSKTLNQTLTNFKPTGSMTLASVNDGVWGSSNHGADGTANLGSGAITDGVGSFSSAAGSRPGGGFAAAITTLFSNGESGSRAAAPSNGGVRGAPGPVAGAGLPFLCVFLGIAYVIVRRRRNASRSLLDPLAG
jgi:hypothetical protein